MIAGTTEAGPIDASAGRAGFVVRSTEAEAANVEVVLPERLRRPR